ncbi:hypothetical protein AUC43_17255 [Hymenobacter sedentarius]|uniref:Uncharacterized protein n=1 Tax=Hymenobacter sedentarius TaxID=1411621 RepID=A0A0U4C6U9_9BACT|nr:hypothetical protein [Hymenobacter sedentarius]ALW86674.1 hypothetical protein AUC43_17255 [Hymenobacter sedentarius]
MHPVNNILPEFIRHRDGRLLPLAHDGSLRLSDEQKHLYNSKAARARQRQAKSRAARKAAKPDFFIVPTEAIARLAELGIMGKALLKHYLFLHLIYQAHHKHELDQSEYMELSSDILRVHLGKTGRVTYVTFRTTLVAWGMIEVNNSYLTGASAKEAQESNPGVTAEAFCKSYRLSASCRSGGFEVVSGIGLNFYKKAQADKAKRHQLEGGGQHIDASLPHFSWLENCLKRLTISQEAYAWIDEQERQQAPLKDKRVKTKAGYESRTNRKFTREIAQGYKLTVDEINARQRAGAPTFTFSPTNGRLNNAFSSLATGLRQFPEIDGVPTTLSGLDLSCSQVYLLLPLLQKTNAAQNAREDFYRFFNLVFTGSFYEEVAKLVTARDKTLLLEGEEKQAFFMHVLFSTIHAAYGYRRAFNKEFPTVNRAILELVTSEVVDPATGEVRRVIDSLAVRLQRQESHLFLERIAAQLHHELGDTAFVVTLHDSIYFEKHHYQVVHRVMTDILFEATGYVPNLKSTNPINHDKWLVAVIEHKATLAHVIELFEESENAVAETQREVHALLFAGLTPAAVISSVMPNSQLSGDSWKLRQKPVPEYLAMGALASAQELALFERGPCLN